MKKKLVVVSIIAIAIFVGVSFASVVGYSSVKSISGEVSPLFSVRTNRSIGKETKEITGNFVNKDITIPFPKNDNRAFLKKIIELSNTGDDWAIKIEVKGDLLGYKVIVTNIGNESINGSLKMNINTETNLFPLPLGRDLKLEAVIDDRVCTSRGTCCFKMGPILGFGPARIDIDGVYQRVGMETLDDCPVVPFGQNIPGFILIFFPLANFKPMMSASPTKCC